MDYQYYLDSLHDVPGRLVHFCFQCFSEPAVVLFLRSIFNYRADTINDYSSDGRKNGDLERLRTLDRSRVFYWFGTVFTVEDDLSVFFPSGNRLGAPGFNESLGTEELRAL